MKKKQDENKSNQTEVNVAYIDASNIRNAMLKSNVVIDFISTANYLRKAHGCGLIKYYEGIAVGDQKSQSRHDLLSRSGIKVRTLKRQSYYDAAITKQFQCSSCSEKNVVEVVPSRVKFKSNCDVKLVVDALYDSYTIGTKNLYFLTCDGDFADLFNTLIRKGHRVSVIAPAYKAKKNNYTSKKITDLSRYYTTEEFRFIDAGSIKDYLSGGREYK